MIINLISKFELFELFTMSSVFLKKVFLVIFALRGKYMKVLNV